jgi:uncharacterized protein YbjT (DUF2867 family)
LPFDSIYHGTINTIYVTLNFGYFIKSNYQKSRNALLVGATGLVGQFCLNFLLKDISYQRVDVLTRHELKIDHPKLNQCLINFDELEKWTHLVSPQDIYCCLGTTIKKAKTKETFRKVDFVYPVNLAKIGHKIGAQQFLLMSSIGANPHSKIFYSRIKGEVEEAISVVPFKGVQIFRPSLLLGNRNELRMGEKIGALFLKTIKFLLIGNFKKYRAISAETVARSMIEMAKVDLKGVNIFESDQIQFFYDRILKKNG